MKKLTVHMIGNAHLDPVWMWSWPAGLDEALNTCRTFCEMLEEYPELILTKGEAWVYEQVRRLDPELFKKVQGFVKEGRWVVVNGWWVQPDCNMQTPEGYIKQGVVGKAWFKKHLGVDVVTGYQVDSFGHNAMMPAFLKTNGINNYIFSRPTSTVCPLPEELFSWQAPTGEKVNAFRITKSYCSRSNQSLQEILDASIKEANRELGHTMSFYGVGDHGGGPSREQIEWILEHKDYRDDVELVFSDPNTFFDIVAESDIELPVVQKELHHSSPGTYAVVHDMKLQMRKAEILASQTDAMMEQFPEDTPEDAEHRMEYAWRDILFNGFHDTLAGTSIEVAYEHARDQLGRAKETSREIIVDMTRKQAFSLPPCLRQRIVLANIGDRHFSGWVDTEPWLGAEAHIKPVRYTDTDGNELSIQKFDGTAAEIKMTRFMVHAEIPSFGKKVIEIHREEPAAVTGDVTVCDNTLSNGIVQVTGNETGISSLKNLEDGTEFIGTGGLKIEVFEDYANTWGGLQPDACFGTKKKSEFKAIGPWKCIMEGPLRAVLSNELVYGQSRILWQVILNTGESTVRMRLRVCYCGQFEIVKMRTPVSFEMKKRVDGIPGANLEREADKMEYPVQGHMSVVGNDAAFSVVSGEIFSGDMQSDGTMRQTLLRSQNYVFNGNFPDGIPDYHIYPLTDQGEHLYDVALVSGKILGVDKLADEIYRQRQPIWISENTNGMPPRHHEQVRVLR